MALGISGFISASGMQDALLRLNTSAHNVANGNTEGYVPARVESAARAGGGVRSGVRVMADASVLSPNPGESLPPSRTSYSEEGVQLILARNAFKANAAALRASLDADRLLIAAFG